MSVQTDFAEGLQTQQFWNFLLKHGCGEVSILTGEQLPEEMSTNELFKKYAEIYKTYQQNTKEHALHIALENGYVDVLDYLYAQKATLYNIEMSDYSSPKTQIWFKTKLKQALTQSFPNPSNTIVPREMNNFFCRGTLENYTYIEKCIKPLMRAIELEDCEFIRKSLPNTSLREREAALLYAIRAKSLVMVKFLHENGVHLNPSEQFTTTPLIEALKVGNLDIINYLIENKVNLNNQNYTKLTPLMVAVNNNDGITIKKLLEKNVDLSLKTVDGENILHIAVANKKKEIIETLSKLPEFPQLVTQKNIYGETPLDVAIRAKDDELIKLLDSETSLEELRRKPHYGHKLQKINQDILIKKTKAYLTLNNRSLTLFPKGFCNGLAILFLIYAAQNQKKYFFDTLKLIASWNGEEDSLKKPFPTRFPQAKYYKNLKELFEQWINDILLFQASSVSIDTTLGIKQSDRVKQIKMIGDKTLKPKMLMNESHSLASVPKRSHKQLEELLGFMLKIPLVKIEIKGSQHAICLHKIKNGKIQVYDSNFYYKTKPFENISDATQTIIDYKFILLKKFSARVPTDLVIYHFKKDKPDFTKFNVFKPHELPRNLEEAKAFQVNSPNGFTHLHVAVMTHSLPDIKKLLKAGFCDVQAVDASGRTIFDYIVCKDLVHEDILKIFLTSPHTSNLEQLLINAIRNADYQLVKRIMDSGKVNVNKCLPPTGVLPLNFALEQYKSIEIAKLLILQGADYLVAGRGCLNETTKMHTPLKQIVIDNPDFYFEFIKQIKDINEKDTLGNNAMHYASMNIKFEILKDLLSRGANPNVVNAGGKHPLDLLIDEDVSRTQKKDQKAAIRLLVPLVNENKLIDYLFLYTISDKNNIRFFEVVYPALLAASKNNHKILNACNAEGLSLLQLAVMSHQLEKVELLLEAGCNVDVVLKPLKNTLLMSLIKFKNEEFPPDQRLKFIEVLLKHGASLSHKNIDGKNALDLVKESTDKNLKSLFIDKGLLTDTKLKI